MCASKDDCCIALHDQDLLDAEWQIIEVSVCLSANHWESPWCLWWIAQEALPIFQHLAELSKLLEGENYVLSSTYWGAVFDVEEVLAPHSEYSVPIAALRQAMHDDHFGREWLWRTRYLMFCMFWWRCWIRGTLISQFFICRSCIVCLLVDGVCIAQWNLQQINGTEQSHCFSIMYHSSFQTTACCLSLFRSLATFS